MRTYIRCGLFALLVLFCGAFSVSHYACDNTLQAAEIRFRQEVIVPRGSVITLGEVAEIVPSSASETRDAQIGALVLFPVPAEKVTYSQVALRDMLSYLGISASEHNFCGASLITIEPSQNLQNLRAPQLLTNRLPNQDANEIAVPAPLPQTSQNPQTAKIISANANATTKNASGTISMASYFTREPPKTRLDQVFLPPQRVKEMEASLAQKISDYFNRCVLETSPEAKVYPWVIALKLDPASAKKIDNAGGVTSVFGGRNPIIGAQELELELANGENFLLSVGVSLPVTAVVVQRGIARGKRISAADVTLVTMDTISEQNYLDALDDAVGMESVVALREGAILTRAMLTPPMCVRKNETVTVYSRAEGINIKTYGKCKDDAPLGAVVTIERQDKLRDTFYARVIGQGTVEVTADAVVVRN